MDRFKAYRIFSENNAVSGRVVEVGLEELSGGTVVFKTGYSSVNYKDALAATGSGKIIRKFPLNAGIDAVGTVVSSDDPRYKTGAEVICTSYDFGVAHDGGFSAYCRVPLSSFAPFPSLHIPAMVRLCLRSTMRTTENIESCASGPAIFRSRVSA